MKQVLMLRFLGWMILLAQIETRVNAGTSKDVWKRAEVYETISQTLQNLVNAEKLLNSQYLRERSESWFHNWKSEVRRSAVYLGYLGCNPDRVVDVIALIRSKLESDALTCMGNMIAEYEYILNESIIVSKSAQKLAQWLHTSADLKTGHFEAILKCLPDPKSNARPGQYTPPRIQRVAVTTPMIIASWRTFRKRFKKTRGACFNFHSLEYHGTTADIVNLFEECVRGDMKDWVYAESRRSEIELESFFKVILQHAYTRAAKFKRSLTSMFDNAIQMSVTTVRKSHVSQSIELIEHFENRNRSAALCWFYLPRLKSLYSDLIRDAYQCLHGTYMNYLDSQKLIEIDANDINRLTTNSSHQTMDLQKENITIRDAVSHFENKVLPAFDSTNRKELEMEQQYENDVLNMKTHLEKAFQCVQNTEYYSDKTALELSKDYVKCSRIYEQQIWTNEFESNHSSDVFLRIDSLHDTALSHAFQILENWRIHQERLLTITPKTTPVCQTHCASKAYAQITKLHDESRSECIKYLTNAKIQYKEAVQRAEYLRKLILNGDEEDLAHQCRQEAILLSDQTAEKFQINEQSCGEVFASRRNNESIIDEFRKCFEFKCFRTCKRNLASWWT